MKKIACCVLSALLALLFAAGCSGLGEAERTAYLDSIPATLPDLSVRSDGDYMGSYKIEVPPGDAAAFPMVSVLVTLRGDRITEITISKSKALAKEEDFTAYKTRIIEAQSLNVDGVSGASYSSKAMAKAIEAALDR